MDLPSASDLYQIGRQYVLDRATRIDPEQVDVQGSDANVFVGSGSVVAFELVKQLAYGIEGLLIDTATGEQLDRLAWDRYQQVRKGASASLVLCDFTRSTTSGGSGTIAQDAIVHTDNNVQYTLLEPASFGASDLVVQGIRCRAVQAGKDYQVGANYLIRFQEQPFDGTITVTNPAASAGGEDREDDDTFRDRVRGFWRAARRGTLAAIQFGALTVDGVASASAVEATDGSGDPARVVTLYFADSSGVASLAQVPAIQAALQEWRAAGIAVTLALGRPQTVQIQLHLTFESGVDTAALTAIVRSAVMEYVNSLGANDTLQVGALQSVLQRYRSNGLVPNDGSIVSPLGDVVPDAGKVLRCTLADVSVV